MKRGEKRERKNLVFLLALDVMRTKREGISQLTDMNIAA